MAETYKKFDEGTFTLAIVDDKTDNLVVGLGISEERSKELIHLTAEASMNPNVTDIKQILAEVFPKLVHVNEVVVVTLAVQKMQQEMNKMHSMFSLFDKMMRGE